MSNLTTRAGKGSPLTNNELDANFTNLNADKVEIGGDLSGTPTAPIVTKVQGQSFSSAAANVGEKLVWNGTAWAPATDPSGEPIGHADKSESSIGFSAGTRTFTISPVSASFVVWCKGVKHTYTSAQTVVIPNTTGLHFIYFNASGVLSTQMTYFTWEEHAPTAYIYWNATTQQAVYFGDERHGITLDWQTHEYLHRTRGAAIANGFGASGYTTTGAGATDADAQIDIGGGTFFDEDMQVDIVSTNTPVAGTWQQDLSGPALIPVLYLSGSSWVLDSPTNFPFKVVSGVPQYNLYSGGTWSTAPVANNEYFVSWILATNNLTYPVIAIISQAPTNQLSGAEAMTFEGLSLNGFPSVEFRPLYKVIYQYKTGFTNSIKASTISVYDLRSLQSAGVAAALVQDHGNLSGLGDDDHAQYLHVSEVRTPSSAVKNSFLPSQTSNNGKYLTTDGINPSWGDVPSGSLTFTGDVTGTGNTGSSTTLTLANSGVTAGTFTKVTVDTKGRVTTGASANSSDIATALGFTPENVANKAVANGYASLDGSGKVPSNQLPSYVDDVLEYANLAAFPATGETGKIYIAIDTIKTYRWSGSAYVEITSSPGSTDAVPEGSTNLYFTNARARAAVGASGSLSYSTATGIFSYTQPTNVSAFTNDSGYLTGITGAQVTSALGYTPYNATNPSGYITGITSGMVTTALGYTPYNSSNPSGYITSSALSSYLPLSGGTLTGKLKILLGGGTTPANYFEISNTSSTAGQRAGLQLNTGSSWSTTFYTESGNWWHAFGSDVGDFRWGYDGTNLKVGSNTVLHAGNYSSYALPLSGGTVSGNLFVTGTIRSTSGVFQLNDGSSTGGGLYFYKTITGSGTSLAPSLFAETGLPLYFMNNGSATPKMTLNTSGELSVTSKIYVGGATVNSGYNGIYGTNMVGAASGNKLVYFFNDGSTLKVDAYDYGTSSPLGFTIGGNGGTVNLYTGATVNGSTILHAGNYGSGYFKTINGSSIIGTGNLTVSGTDNTKLPLTGGTLTGELYVPSLTVGGQGRSALNAIGGNIGATAGSWNNAQLELKSTDAGTVALAFHRAGYTSNTIEVRDGNGLRIDGSFILHSGNYNSYALPLSGGTLTGAIYVGTTSSGSAARALRVGPSGGSPASFGSYTGSWRSTIEIWDNAATRMLHLTPPDGTNYNYSSIKSTDAGLRIDVGGSGGTNAIDIGTNGVANFPQGLQQGGNQVLHAGNYSSYSPSLTGSGASGTWGIRITGFANQGGPRLYSTDASYNYDGVAPYYGYLTYDGSRWLFQVSPATPAAVRVAYADSAGSADQIDSWGFRNTGSNSAVNADTIESNGITYYTAGVPNFSGNSTDGALYSQMYSSSWQHQIAADYRSGQIALRGKNSGTWQSWRTVLDSSNYSSYALPLSGGTMTGHLALGDNRLYLRTNGDTNHYLWNAADDWEELVAYFGTGFRVQASNGTTIATFATGNTYIYSPLNTTDVINLSYNITGSVATSARRGIELHNPGGNDYWIGKRAGAWTQPLDVSFYTGIRYHAHQAYGGHRFYTTGYDSTYSMSVGDGDSNVRVYSNLYVSGESRGYDVYTTGGWFRNHTNNNGIYWSATGWHLYPTNSNDFYFRSGSSESSIRFTNSSASELGFLHCASDSAMGFLTSGRSWRFRVDNSGNARCYNNLYIDQNYGHGIVGLYASTRYQGVFAMGDSYKLPADGTGPGNLYGLAWSYPSAGGVAGNLDSHGLLVLINGGLGSAISYSIVAAGNVTAYSDERLKTNWREMPENYVERLAQVKVGIYDRIDGEKITQVGIGAQSFQRLLPEAITKATDEMGTLSVSYGNAAMASAVELAKELVILKKELAEIKSRLH